MKTSSNYLGGYELPLDHGLDEGQVFLPSRNKFTDGQIVHFQTPTHNARHPRTFQLYQSIAPSVGQNCGGLIDAVRVIAEGLMEQRFLSDCAIYHNCAIGIILSSPWCNSFFHSRRISEL